MIKWASMQIVLTSDFDIKELDLCWKYMKCDSHNEWSTIKSILNTKYARINAEIELCNWVNMWMSRVFVIALVFTTV